MTLPADIAERLRAHAGFVENGGCADHGMTDEPWLLREAADEIDRLTGTLARPTLNLDLIEVVAMGLCAKTAIKNGGAGHGCWWELGAEAKDGFRDIAGSLIASQPSPAAPVETERHCQKCGETTKGEEALVDGQIWCHPCADHNGSSAGSEPVEFINRRLADMAEANSLYGKDQRLGAPDKIARNNREISWLKELRSIILIEPQAVSVPWKGNLSVDLRKGALRINADGVTLIDEAGTCWAIVFPDKTGSYDHAATITSLLSRPKRD